jgi:hypothetical protein
MKQSNMNRRDFVERLLVLPMGVFLLRCSSSSTATYSTAGAGSDVPGAPPAVVGQNAVYTSSNVEAHVHTFAINLGDFVDPPDDGLNGETSEDQQHTHTVSVSNLNLKSVQNGNTLKITTSSNFGHTHVFTFVRVA